ncbi:MAG: hypothetical protein AB7Q16_14720 [Vicinamibacterales bacterium]
MPVLVTARRASIPSEWERSRMGVVERGGRAGGYARRNERPAVG